MTKESADFVFLWCRLVAEWQGAAGAMYRVIENPTESAASKVMTTQFSRLTVYLLTADRSLLAA